MRKVDYQTLARVIEESRRETMNRWFDDEAERLRHLETIRRIACNFAQTAHVDKAQFLKACGIDP